MAHSKPTVKELIHYSKEDELYKAYDLYALKEMAYQSGYQTMKIEFLAHPSTYKKEHPFSTLLVGLKPERQVSIYAHDKTSYLGAERIAFSRFCSHHDLAKLDSTNAPLFVSRT